MIRFRSKKPIRRTGGSTPPSPKPVDEKLTWDLEANLEHFQKLTGGSPDFIVRKFYTGIEHPVKTAIAYLDSMVNTDAVNNLVMRSLLGEPAREATANEPTAEGIFRLLQERALTVGEIKGYQEWKIMMAALLSGDTLIFVDGCERVIGCSTRGGESRAVSEPTTQNVVRGPKDAFVESLFTNVALIRRRIKSTDLALEVLQIGETTLTNVALLYMKTIADENTVDEVRRRVNDINIDAIFESGMVEELVQDRRLTPFPTIYNSERPDTVASNLLEGRIGLIIDGSPFVLMMPAVFANFFQSSADYAERYDLATALRLLRYVCFIILVLGPSIYIAFTTFHYEMIPTPLLISILAQRETVPFPAFLEAVLLESTFEIMREAGIRMPRLVGQTVSIAGAVVLGQAAVQAGIVTPLLTIVVAITGIASFAIPSYNMANSGRLFRFGFMVLAALFGLYGLALGLITLVAHLTSLKSFGVNYMSPFSPFDLNSLKDTILRLPAWKVKKRPLMTSSKNMRRARGGPPSAEGQES
ncbi:spore germination protein [Paenibacillus jiagnxiensis]|uniref:spore germination protein n=1 Tax=Paenibacillus jiagnxiensis TaxID=3228926 RepID=UPI0033B5C53A